MSKRKEIAAEIDRLRQLVRDQRCPVDCRYLIGECIDKKQCSCSVGLLLASRLEG
jgi:hypothetical protein